MSRWSPGRSWSRPTMPARSCRRPVRRPRSARWTQTPRCRPTTRPRSRWTPPRPPMRSMRPACPRPPRSCGCSTRRCSTGRRSVRPDCVWRTEVTDAHPTIRELVLVDARTGGIALEFDQIAEGLDREVCDDANVRDTNNEPSCTAPFDRRRVKPADRHPRHRPGLRLRRRHLRLLLRRFGRDSLDDNGTDAAQHRPLLPADLGETCPVRQRVLERLADGLRRRLRAGRRRRRPRAHARRHRVHVNLLYYYQSGAINESLSDVFGELIDLATARATTPPACAG